MDYNSQNHPDTDWFNRLITWLVQLIFMAFLLSICTADKKTSSRSRYYRAKHLVDKLHRQRQRAAAHGRSAINESCPICLEDFEVGGASPGGGPGGGGTAQTKPLEEPLLGGAVAAPVVSSSVIVSSSSWGTPLPPPAVPDGGSPSRSAVGDGSAPLSEETVCLPCNHQYHRECLQKWLEGPNQTCPICRAALGESGGSSSRGGEDDHSPGGVREAEMEREMRSSGGEVGFDRCGYLYTPLYVDVKML